jgi:hypothetical protein
MYKHYPATAFVFFIVITLLLLITNFLDNSFFIETFYEWNCKPTKTLEKILLYRNIFFYISVLMVFIFITWITKLSILISKN